MKGIKILPLVFALAFWSCNSDTVKKDVKLLSVNQSDCNNQKSVAADSLSERIVVKALGDGRYSIEHLNSWFNCCLSEGIAIDAWFRNDTLFFSEREKVMGTCKCICPYDVSAEIGNLADGDYVLCIIKATTYLGTANLFFNKTLNEEILVSELTDNL
jgi:hypothetical protein